jgi:hypothetical protein
VAVLLTPRILATGTHNLQVSFSITPLLVIISEATVSGKREGISNCVHILSDFITSALVSWEFLSKSANRKTVKITVMPLLKLSFMLGFVFFVILLSFRS